jgi:hypothetical protein
MNSKAQSWQHPPMFSSNLPALGRALDAAERSYLEAQHNLVSRIEGAMKGWGDWPGSADYAHTAELGQAAAQARRKYHDVLGIGCPSRAPMKMGDRLELIQTLSARERTWQPLPEDWLRKNDQQD